MKKYVGFTLITGMLVVAGCADAAPSVDDTSTEFVTGEEEGGVAPVDGGKPGTGGGGSSGDGGTTGGAKPTEDGGPEPDPSLIRIADGCIENRDFVGQMYPKPDAPNNGGMAVTSPFDPSYDSGIAALYEAVLDANQVATGLQLQITNATVTATGYDANASKQFWVQDGKAAVHIRMATPVTIGDQQAVVKVGSKLSFVVESLKKFSGVLQIEKASGFTFTGTEQPVHLDDRTGGDIAASDVNRLIRVTGVLTGAPEPCGTTPKCWKLNYKGKTEIRFRSASKFIDTGACVTFVGPVSLFDGVPELDTSNFGWLWSAKKR